MKMKCIMEPWPCFSSFLVVLPSSNVTDNHDKVGTCRNGHIRALTLNGHTYYWKNHWFAHAGDCKKCKHELDSIVKAAVKEAMQCE